MTVGMLGSWEGLDPWEAQELFGVVVRQQCFESLYRRVEGELRHDPRFLAQPVRMETMGLNGKPRYTTRLAEGLRFSDGRPVQPEDVARSLGRVATLREVTRIKAAGSGRVQFSTLVDDVDIEFQLAQIWSIIGKRGAGFWVGTGPYMIAEESQGASGEVLILTRNPHWEPGDRRKPTIERIAFRVYPVDERGRPTALREAVESGEVDFTLMLPRDVAKGLQGVRKVYQPGQSTAFLSFNCERRSLRNAAVRRALSSAIDPWQVARVCHDNPAAFAARGVLPPAMAPTERSLPKYGAETAAAALAEIPDRPTRLKMLTVWGPRPYLPAPAEVAAVLVEQFEAVGVKVEVERAASPQAFFEAVRRGHHDLILSGHIAENPDPVDFLAALLSSKRSAAVDAAMASSTNIGRFRDPDMDRALARARADATQIAGVNQRFEECCPLVPLMYGASVAVHGWHVRDFDLGAQGIPYFADLSIG
ncbi:dipeptide ABC transporter substrate-binding protein [Plesiocystis pacifica SIR-1]|uniref:Dipeptide ABC transporter substrate-binding protein n=1 Tax=Plesiocystis pacifica SIR-1 TaxID=391625 RepID=A6GC89_9BACT|nr:dipeptide ABC transporter substrate-binding protein [Plesiocystis pacifica SIR-1]